MPKTEITKAALAACLRELMSQKKLSQITIADITLQCGISRNAFYYHFRDKYDLINWIFYSETLPIIDSFFGSDRHLDGFVNLCQYMLNNRQFYIEVFQYVGQNSLCGSLTETYFELMKIHISTLYANINCRLSEDELYILARLSAHAYVGVIMEWVTNGMQSNYMIYFEKLNKIKIRLAFPLDVLGVQENLLPPSVEEEQKKTEK